MFYSSPHFSLLALKWLPPPPLLSLQVAHGVWPSSLPPPPLPPLKVDHGVWPSFALLRQQYEQWGRSFICTGYVLYNIIYTPGLLPPPPPPGA